MSVATEVDTRRSSKSGIDISSSCCYRLSTLSTLRRNYVSTTRDKTCKQVTVKRDVVVVKGTVRNRKGIRLELYCYVYIGWLRSGTLRCSIS